MSTLGRVILASCTVFAAFLGASGAWSQTPVKTNLDVMTDLTTQVVDELVAGFPGGSTPREVRLAPAGRDERYDFIGSVLLRSLTAKGYRAFAAAPMSPADSTGAAPLVGGAGLKLEYRVVDFTLRYPKIYRSHLIGGKKVKRSGGVRVLATLMDSADGLVVWTGEAGDAYDDVFPYGSLEQVETSVYQFAKPPRESRKWGRVVEPVVVSGIIVGLIYLFFSNQGD